MKIYMLVDASKRKDGVKELWKIKDLAKATGDVITSHILFIHVWSGLILHMQCMDKLNLQITQITIRNSIEYFLTF